jgi:hypothetical protein
VRRPLPDGHGFHERATPCQVKSFGRLSNNSGSPTQRETRHSVPTVFLSQKGFPPFADSPCFHSHSSVEHLLRCQLESSISKRVLPSLCRTESPRFRDVRSAVTSQSPELGDWLQTTTCLRLPSSSSKTTPPGCCATARTLPRTPTTGAATPPAFAPPPQSHASSHSCRRARPASAPTVSNPCPARVDSKYSVLPAPASCVNTRRLLY